MKANEDLRLLANLAEQTERYGDMTKFAKQILKKSPQIDSKDIKIFATAYKCKISERRTAWRAVSALLLKESNSINKPIIVLYKGNLENEIREISGEVIETVNQILSKRSERGVATKNKQNEKQQLLNRLELHKIKGDYLRYLCEISKQTEIKAVKDECDKSYNQAIKLIDSSGFKQLLKTDAVRLAIYLNYAVFQYEICNNIPEAIKICEKGFNDSLGAVSNLEDSGFTDIVTVMQLMHDNITAWKLELEKSPK